MNSNKVQKSVDTNKVECRKWIEINILIREAQKNQNELGRMMSAVGVGGEDFLNVTTTIRESAVQEP